MRASFYRRFDPRRQPSWQRDGEAFLYAALRNTLIWKSESDRETLSQLCWDHPDPRSNMNMPNPFRGMEEGMRTEHPDWFSDAQDRAPMTGDVMKKIANLEKRLKHLASSGKPSWRK